jgi:hypothetical protein
MTIQLVIKGLEEVEEQLVETMSDFQKSCISEAVRMLIQYEYDLAELEDLRDFERHAVNN